jgi:hypothetical protein
MKIYLLTSNKYTEKLCPINIHFLNKYWPDNDITIVGYEDVDELENLPSNVTKVSLGLQEDYGSRWTNALIPFFKKIPEDYFALVFDDHILMNKVDQQKIKVIEDQFVTNSADKAMIGGGISLLATKQFEKNENLLVFSQAAEYRMSLHPAIWSKNYFLKYLFPNMTSWDFELQNNGRAQGDGGVILNYKYDYPNEPHLFSYLELYTKGRVNINESSEVVTNQPSSRYFNIEDIKFIWENLH